MEINGEEISSEIHSFTTENVLQLTRSLYDPASEKITNEVARGICSTCGRPVAENNVVMCYFDDLVCSICSIPFTGRSICRRHVEVFLGSKAEAIILISIGFGFNKKDIKKVSGLSEDSIELAKNMLASRGYIKIKSLGLVGNSSKITETGSEVVETLVKAYRTDLDFKTFLERVGWNKIVEAGSRQK